MNELIVQNPKGGADCDSIWLLDDDVSMLKALGRLMNSVGLRVEKFKDPIAFLGRLKHAQCHVAVIDIGMPQLSGLKVQARLRQDSPETREFGIWGQCANLDTFSFSLCCLDCAIDCPETSAVFAATRQGTSPSNWRTRLPLQIG
jgi:hypothetical protein